MSGTSLDGIDVALLRTDGETEVSRGPGATYPYRPDQQAVLHDALNDAKALDSRDARPGILAEADWPAGRLNALPETTLYGPPVTLAVPLETGVPPRLVTVKTRCDVATVAMVPKSSCAGATVIWPGVKPVPVTGLAELPPLLLKVTVPFDSADVAASVMFDGVTSALKVNGNLHAPLLCVSNVFKVGSGDLSLPGKATPAKK